LWAVRFQVKCGEFETISPERHVNALRLRREMEENDYAPHLLKEHLKNIPWAAEV
jgi:hypothetical protein